MHLLLFKRAPLCWLLWALWPQIGTASAVSQPGAPAAEATTARAAEAVYSSAGPESNGGQGHEPASASQIVEDPGTAAAPAGEQAGGKRSPLQSKRPVLLPTPIPAAQAMDKPALPPLPVLLPKGAVPLVTAPRQSLEAAPEQRTLPSPQGEPATSSAQPAITETVPLSETQAIVVRELDRANVADKLPSAPAKPAPIQVKKPADPCGKGFRVVRSKVKRPGKLIMTHRKPVFDPCLSRNKAIKVKAAKPNRVKAAPMLKRMCFSGGELRPCP